MQNIQAIGSQGLLFILAFFYLLIRNVDFRIFTDRIKWTKRVPLQIIGFFLVSTLLMDVYTYVSYYIPYMMTPSVSSVFSELDITLVLYFLLNGFFLGICLAVKPKHIYWGCLFSLLVRISFHTYQGLGGVIALLL
ncbi:hypothetical protein [Streptococcus catagoni]|uniref:hypothetical protein n=1 Tax=Streptococcus catagoni TaxID=2654874 RepID=UPI001408D023|nr:hypothetical protein [Streptococcus catagoni]